MKTEKITKNRILQISNNITEGDGKYTKEELKEVCKYWMKKYEKLYNKYMGNKTEKTLDGFMSHIMD